MSTLTGFRISPQQAAWWQQSQAEPSHPPIVWLEVHPQQPITESSLRARLVQLTEREEILRTRLRAVAGLALPIQVINEDAQVAVDVFDGRGLSEQAQAKHLADLCSSPVQEPPLHVALIQKAENCQTLLLRAAASHLDLQSLARIASELVGRTAHEERLQYADYAEWKCSLLEDEAHSAGVRFWQQQVDEPVDVLLPGLQAPAAPSVFSPGWADVNVGVDTAELRQQALALGASLDEYIFAAWCLLLARLRGETQIRVAWVDGGRGEGLDNALGCFEQALPITVEFDLARSFASQLNGLLKHKRLSLGWSDYFAGQHLCAAHFAYRQFHDTAVANALSTAAAHRLGLDCFERGGELRWRIVFDRAVFSDAAIACVSEQLQRLIQGLGDPAAPAGAIDLQGAQQARHLHAHETDPAVESVDITTLIARRAQSHPDLPAVADRTGGLTYAELAAQSNQLAHHLLKSDVRAGDVVGILLPRCNKAIVAMLAVLKAGGTYLPLDPSYPADRLVYMAEDSGLRCLISTAAHNDLLPAAPHRVLLDELATTLAQESTQPLAPIADLDRLAYLIYTSGSTGKPKAVEISHRNLSHSTQVRMAFYREPVRAYLLLSSLAFDSSVAGIYWTLAQGGLLVLPADKEELDLAALATLIQTHRISHSLSLPSLYENLLEFASTEQLASLNTWIVAGEACAPQVLAKHRQKLPEARLVNEYGPTEATVWATAEVLTEVSEISIGRPIPAMQLHLVNEQGVLAALGEPGEIHLGGPSLSPGYRARPEHTAKAFVRYPGIAGGERLYKTGDLARFDLHGRLSFLGRTDHQVKIRGYRVELGEIERQLKNHSDVRDAAVVALESPGGKRLVAYTTSRHGYAPETQALAEFLAACLPSYMVPGAFITLKQLPRTPNGKLDINALPDPDQTHNECTDFVAPRTELEGRLAAICAEVLRRERVGVNDSFFQIGGDSILSLQIVARASQQGIRITARQVFECETVARMAEVASLIEPSANDARGQTAPQRPTASQDFSLAGLNDDEFANLLDELNAD